jgi:sugar (pentulose or hexulose) kinase
MTNGGHQARHSRWPFVAAGRRREELRTSARVEDAFAAAIHGNEHRKVAAMFEPVIGAVDKVIEAVWESTGFDRTRVVAGGSLSEHHRRMVTDLLGAQRRLDQIRDAEVGSGS